MPSAFGEGFSNVLVEGMLTNLLPIATDVGDAKYILNNERLIIPAKNNLEAAKKIINLLRSKDANKVLIDCKKRAELLFDEDIMVKKYENIWKTIL